MFRCRNAPEIRTRPAYSYAPLEAGVAGSPSYQGSTQMRTIAVSMTAVLAVAVAAATVATAPAEAKSCFKKAAEGVALTESLAKFQVDAALLQATDWSIYFTWVGGGSTPGYTFGPRSYKCSPGQVMGWQCKGSATLCKL